MPVFPLYETPTETMKRMQQQIAAMEARNQELTAALEAEAKRNAEKDAEIERLTFLLERAEAIVASWEG